MVRFIPYAFLCVFLFSSAAKAQGGFDFETRAISFYEQQVKPWVNEQAIIEAIKTQNERNKHLTEEDILKLDQQWRGEVGGSIGNKKMIGTLINKSISKFLREKALASKGFISEIIVMDNKGLNVGISNITSDYWQGDEDKWMRTYFAGVDKMHITESYFDESAQLLQKQLSITISENGSPIGAITIGIDAEKLVLID